MKNPTIPSLTLKQSVPEKELFTNQIDQEEEDWLVQGRFGGEAGGQHLSHHYVSEYFSEYLSSSVLVFVKVNRNINKY